VGVDYFDGTDLDGRARRVPKRNPVVMGDAEVIETRIFNREVWITIGRAVNYVATDATAIEVGWLRHHR